MFPKPTKNVIFLAIFHKFLQFCLSNSDVSTTFGHFSQKSPLCRCGSYTHGSQRLMVSTEIIKNWGGQNGGGVENNLGGGAFAPPLPPPWRRHCMQRRTLMWKKFSLIEFFTNGDIILNFWHTAMHCGLLRVIQVLTALHKIYDRVWYLLRSTAKIGILWYPANTQDTKEYQ